MTVAEAGGFARCRCRERDREKDRETKPRHDLEHVPDADREPDRAVELGGRGQEPAYPCLTIDRRQRDVERREREDRESGGDRQKTSDPKRRRFSDGIRKRSADQGAERGTGRDR